MPNLSTIMPTVEDRIVDEVAPLAFHNRPELMPIDLTYHRCGLCGSKCKAGFASPPNGWRFSRRAVARKSLRHKTNHKARVTADVRGR